MKNIKSITNDNSRFQNISSTFLTKASQEKLCVEYTLIYEDHAYKNVKDNKFVLTRQKGMICQHPKSNHLGIDISYQELALSTSKYKSYSKEGDIFLSTLKFF